MNKLTDPKFLIVRRQTRLEELVVKYNTVEQSRFYIEHLGQNFRDYEIEHTIYVTALQNVESQLRQLGRVQIVDRFFLSNYVFREDEFVIVVGQDGLVANTLKYVWERPVIGINPDPSRYDGVLLPFDVDDAAQIAAETVAGKRPFNEVTLARAELNNKQVLYAVNDLFVGPKSHTSARYEIQFGDQSEIQSSSGVIVSTGLGSTGWLRSVLAGAAGITGKKDVKLAGKPARFRIPWSTRRLFFAVREPFPSNTTGTELVIGSVGNDEKLTLRSLMPENGVIFSDGIEADYLEFSSGLVATITLAERQGRLVQ